MRDQPFGHSQFLSKTSATTRTIPNVPNLFFRKLAAPMAFAHKEVEVVFKWNVLQVVWPSIIQLVAIYMINNVSRWTWPHKSLHNHFMVCSGDSAYAIT
jgi:hypothetical protein